MITKYRTQHRTFGREILAIEILSETKRQVVYRLGDGSLRRENKSGTVAYWHDTWDAAHEFLMAEANNKIKRIRRELELANSLLGGIKGMKRP